MVHLPSLLSRQALVFRAIPRLPNGGFEVLVVGVGTTSGGFTGAGCPEGISCPVVPGPIVGAGLLGWLATAEEDRCRVVREAD